ncbi:unnamed protein product [Sphagnum balticum]
MYKICRLCTLSRKFHPLLILQRMDSAGGMPKFKAIKSNVDIEDKVQLQRRVLQVILRPGDESGSGVPLYLEQLAARTAKRR